LKIPRRCGRKFKKLLGIQGFLIVRGEMSFLKIYRKEEGQEGEKDLRQRGKQRDYESTECKTQRENK